VIVAVELELIEAEHKLLQNGLCLERDGAIQVGFILGSEDSAVDLAVELLQEMSFTEGCHVICMTDRRSTTTTRRKDKDGS